MGSEKVDQIWTANRLNVTTRTVRNYVRDGLLKQYVVNNRAVYDRSEVEQLAIDQGSDVPALTRKTVFALVARIQKLEQDMEVMRRALAIQNAPLRPTNTEALELYQAASLSLGCRKWHLDEMKMWSTVFDRLDEPALQLIGSAAVLDKPWETFFQLCLAQINYISQLPGFATNLELQMLHKQLDEGRKKLRSSILIWIELHRGQSQVQDTLQVLEKGTNTLLRRLGGKSS
jgi:hypothetical protein